MNPTRKIILGLICLLSLWGVLSGVSSAQYPDSSNRLPLAPPDLKPSLPTFTSPKVQPQQQAAVAAQSADDNSSQETSTEPTQAPVEQQQQAVEMPEEETAADQALPVAEDNPQALDQITVEPTPAPARQGFTTQNLFYLVATALLILFAIPLCKKINS